MRSHIQIFSFGPFEATSNSEVGGHVTITSYFYVYGKQDCFSDLPNILMSKN